MAATGDRDPDPRARWVRGIDFVLGLWLFVSAFLWPHAPGSRLNTWLVGALVGIFAVWAMFVPLARWVNTLLALWLFFSTIAITQVAAGTLWNNVAVAILLFFLSLIPTGAAVRPRPPAHA